MKYLTGFKTSVQFLKSLHPGMNSRHPYSKHLMHDVYLDISKLRAYVTANTVSITKIRPLRLFSVYMQNHKKLINAANFENHMESINTHTDGTCHDSSAWLLVFRRGGPSLKTGQPMWDLWSTNRL